MFSFPKTAPLFLRTADESSLFGPAVERERDGGEKNKKEKPKNANVSVGAKLSFALFSSRALLLRATVICEVPRHRQDGVRQARLLME